MQKVYVACNPECLEAWNRVTRDLSAHGFDVQPTGPRGPEYELNFPCGMR